VSARPRAPEPAHAAQAVESPVSTLTAPDQPADGASEPRTASVDLHDGGEEPGSQHLQPFHPPLPARKRIGDLLVSNAAITPAQLVEALKRQEEARLSANGHGGTPQLGQILIDLGAIDEHELIGGLARQLDVEFFDLGTATPSPDAVALLDEAFARAHLAMPVRCTDTTVDVVVADPTDVDLIPAVRSRTGRDVRLFVAPADEIRATIARNYSALAASHDIVQAFEIAEQARPRALATAAPSALATAAAEAAAAAASSGAITDDLAPVIQIVNLMLTQAVRDRASDVHIEPQEHELRVRFRIDGALREVLQLPLSMAAATTSRIKVMAGMNIVERRRPQDGQFETMVDNRALDVRVSTTATVRGEKAVLRILDKSRSLYTMPELGMPASVAPMYSRLVKNPFGMVICAGPTGSGKTTTLYATVNDINDLERNIMTIEDPVEYVFPGVNQIQINELADMSFAGGLKSILRQDPDVILVGEVRDAETARIAVQSALTGHLVLSSLHATDAASALHRLLDMGIESFLVAAAITGVVGQRLVRRVCRSCREPYTLTAEELTVFENGGGYLDGARFMKGAGCNFCSHTGYQDRIGVYEVLVITDSMRQLVLERASHQILRDQAILEGMRTMQQAGFDLVAAGVTTVEEVLRSVYTG
jgi:type IV pilus assembly protein PilB